MSARLRYFDGVRGLRDAHRRYRELAKRLHPDNHETGNVEWFKEMATEYAAVVEALRARRAPRPLTQNDATEAVARSERRNDRSAEPRRPKRSPELDRALEGLADAAGNVVVAWLKERMQKNR